MNRPKTKKIMMMTFLSIFLVVETICSANESKPTAIIPKPAKMELTGGFFVLKPETAIYVRSGSPEIRNIASYFIDLIEPAIGFKLSLGESSDSQPPAGSILLTTRIADTTLGAEGYELIIRPDSILIRAAYPTGLFYGVVTLRQLLPVQIESKQKVDNVAWEIPCVRIADQPRFPWRSFMLDSVRHFQTKEFIKRYIDLLALYKINRFHWHLTDDQGWRMEIKQYPKLTEIGAWRGKGKNRSNGGFYTQQDIREVVAYAQSRNITVVPEIEMPSHATTALFCYPEFSCAGVPLEPGDDGLGYYTDKNGWMVFCAGNEQTFTFLQNILTEVMDVFDTPYIHIGGEELRKGAWVDCDKCQARMKELGMTETSQLHHWMIARMSKFITGHNRRPVAWSDKSMHHGIPANQIVQGWHPGWVEFATQRGFEALNSLHKIYYLNYPSSEEDRAARPDYPEWMLTNTIQKLYAADPIPDGLTVDQQELVLGGESPLWTELVPQERVDEKVFPRLIALAEVLWTSKNHLDFENFSSRLETHYHRLDRLGVTYLRPPDEK